MVLVVAAMSLLCAGDTPEAHSPHSPANYRLAAGEVYCGGEPTGEGQFLFLQLQGIRTLVSVDGAMPDTALAEKYGLRYVHIPFGYEGVPETAGLALARLMRDVEGSKFIHCHHGKHRGPAAAAIALLAAEEIDASAAKLLLQEAGTSPEYAGLWKSVAEFQCPAADVELPDLVAVAKVDSFAAAMARADRSFDALKAMHETGWVASSKTPDTPAAHEAVLLWEAFREAGRHLDSQPDAMGAEFREALGLTQQLRAALVIGDEASNETADRVFNQLAVSCNHCHKHFR